MCREEPLKLLKVLQFFSPKHLILEEFWFVQPEVTTSFKRVCVKKQSVFQIRPALWGYEGGNQLSGVLWRTPKESLIPKHLLYRLASHHDYSSIIFGVKVFPEDLFTMLISCIAKINEINVSMKRMALNPRLEHSVGEEGRYRSLTGALFPGVIAMCLGI